MNNPSKKSSPTSKKAGLKEQTGKTGAIKRFLDWIAKGATKPDMSGNSCPS